MDSETLNNLFLHIKTLCRFSNLMFRDLSPEERYLVIAIRYRSELQQWQSEREKKLAMTTASLLNECEPILPKEDLEFWRLVQGCPDKEHKNTLIEFRPDAKISVCFQVENGNRFNIIGVGSYGPCDGLDCAGATYSFDVDTMKALQRGQVAEIYYLFINSTDVKLWGGLVLHMVANVYLTGKSSKIEKLICTAETEMQEDVLRNLGFRLFNQHTNANGSPIYILNHLGDLVVERPSNKYCNDGGCNY